MGIVSYVHAGVVVRDLDAAVRFFELLGAREVGRAVVEGAWADRVIGTDGMRSEIVMVAAPDGTGELELSRFLEPEPDEVPRALPSTALGLRHVAYRVDDLRATVETMATAGYGLVGEIVDYEGVYLLAYARGPEGLIVELAEDLRPPSE